MRLFSSNNPIPILSKRLYTTVAYLVTYNTFIPVLGHVVVGASTTYIALGVGVVLCTTIVVSTIYCRSVHGPIISQWRIAITFGARLSALRLVERYIDDSNDATNTLRILQKMILTDEHIRKFVTEVGGIETTIKAMRKYSEESEGVAASGSGLLQALCGYSDGIDRKIMECGGISVLIYAMKHWPENEEVQANACLALSLLASSEDISIRKKIVDVGGLVALAEARTKHQHDVRVSSPAGHAIIRLVANGKGWDA